MRLRYRILNVHCVRNPSVARRLCMRVDVCAQYFVKLLGLVSAMLASLWLVGRCVKPARQAAPSPPSPPRPRSPTMMLLALRAEASACTRVAGGPSPKIGEQRPFSGAPYRCFLASILPMASCDSSGKGCSRRRVRLAGGGPVAAGGSGDRLQPQLQRQPFNDS